MFARILALLPIVALVSASHLEARDQCNTGPVRCCSNDSLKQVEPDSPLGLLDLAFELLDSAGCGGVGSNGCDPNSQPVCCSGNNFNGLVNVGCNPVNIGGIL